MASAQPNVTYRVDPDHPRAPPQDVWDQMSEAERAQVVASLPIEVPLELCPPEGDAHLDAKVDARRVLRDFFGRTGRKIYISSELMIYYPGEPPFSSDVFAVLDVEPHQRTSWIVSKEGKGLDFVIEVHFAGDRAKDLELNVERYARLGIQEYFVFDRGALTLHGFRLPVETKPGRPRRYQPILPQYGQYTSEVLGLELMIQGEKLRFYHASAPLPEADEVIARLGGALDGVIARQRELELAVKEEQRKREEAEQAREEEQRKREEEQRKREEEQRKREEAEREREEATRKLAEVLAELDRLKGR